MDVSCSVELVTPEVAKVFLSNNSINRKVRNTRVNLYATEMADGEFLLTGESIIIGWDGGLLNGQHRLLACQKSGTSFWTVVVRGIDPSVFDRLDTGLPRAIGDVLRKLQVSHYNQVAAAMRLVLGYEGGALSSTNSLQLATRRSVIEDEISAHRSTYEFFTRHQAAAKTIGLQLSALIAFGVLASRRASVDDVERFLGSLLDGVGLERGDPRLALRNWLASSRSSDNIVTLSAITRAWNGYVGGQELKQIRTWYRGTPFPLIVGNLDDGR